MRGRRRLRRKPWWLSLVVGLLLGLQALLPASAATERSPALLFEPHARLIPIEQQPFYGELVRDAGAWSDVVLGQVVGDSPRATLLNFYAVMAEVGDRADRLGRYDSLLAARSQGLDRQEQIDDTDLLFRLGVKALDASVFPQSVRVDMAEEAAIQLKHVLDYVFTHSVQPITIPDAAGMKALNDERTKPVDAWRIPGTAITLTSDLVGDPENDQYVFSADTVQHIHEMYEEIREFPVIPQPFATPLFYHDFILTPGYLVPPDWYLRFPKTWRSVFEIPLFDQTLFQVACAVLVISLYAVLAGWLIRRLLESYRDQVPNESASQPWLRGGIAWRRFFTILPLLPLTRLTEYLIDDEVNFTGLPLVIVTYSTYVIWYVTAGLVVFFFFEAVGRSGSGLLTRLRGAGSDWRRQRVSSFLMPLCRALGALIAVVIVIAFSFCWACRQAQCWPSRRSLVWRLVWGPPSCWAICLRDSPFRPTAPFGLVSSAGSATTSATSPRLVCVLWSCRPWRAGSRSRIPLPMRPRSSITPGGVTGPINTRCRALI